MKVIKQLALLLFLLSHFSMASPAEIAETPDPEAAAAEAAVESILPKCYGFQGSDSFNHLVGFWPADGYNHNYFFGKFNKAPTCVFDQGGKVMPVSCLYDRQEKALNFRGGSADPVVRIETNDFNFDASDSFTIMMRIKPKDVKASPQALVVKGNWEWDFGVWLRSGELTSGSHSNDHSWVDGVYKLQNLRWYHIAYVYNDGESHMFVNGRDVGVTRSYRINENGTGGGYLGFGSRGEVVGHKFKGLMTEVAIFNEALPPEDIYRIAVRGICTGPFAGLLPRFVVPFDNQVSAAMIEGISWVNDQDSRITNTYFRVDDRDKVAMRISDETSNDGRVYGVTKKAISDIGLHDLCVWAEDSYGRESEKDCILLPVYDRYEGYILGSGELIAGNAFTAFPEFFVPTLDVAFMVRYAENEGDGQPTNPSQVVFRAGDDFVFESTRFILTSVNEGTGSAFFRGFGTIDGHPSPSGDNYRFEVWAQDNDDYIGKLDFRDKLHVKIYWKEPKRGMNVVVYDNELSQRFYGEVKIDPGATAKENV